MDEYWIDWKEFKSLYPEEATKLIIGISCLCDKWKTYGYRSEIDMMYCPSMVYENFEFTYAGSPGADIEGWIVAFWRADHINSGRWCFDPKLKAWFVDENLTAEQYERFQHDIDLES